ncbi:MAG: 3,8-cyclase [Verrucomicrobiota bacterium]|jgi:cyclic pyranopterin phosphate synthase
MIDPNGRQVDYLRISVTDRCNERCLYCLPENYSNWLPRAEVLSDAELLAVARTAVALGFKKFRVTGGEPLVRPGVVNFIRELIATPGVESVQLTTNGTRLPELAQPLFDAGLRRINISLDALDANIYRTITSGDVTPVLQGIKLVKQLGFPSVKLNTVLMRGKNDGEILPLLNFAAEHDLAIRFIELMPVSLTEMLSEKNFLPIAEVFSLLKREDELEPMNESLGFGPAKYFRLKKRGVTVGLIGALSDLHFCERCNKMRLTCDGKLRPCLGNHLETDLKPGLRPQIDEAHLQKLFRATLAEKPSEHLFRNNYQPQRVMTAIGG